MRKSGVLIILFKKHTWFLFDMNPKFESFIGTCLCLYLNHELFEMLLTKFYFSVLCIELKKYRNYASNFRHLNTKFYSLIQSHIFMWQKLIVVWFWLENKLNSNYFSWRSFLLKNSINGSLEVFFLLSLLSSTYSSIRSERKSVSLEFSSMTKNRIQN